MKSEWKTVTINDCADVVGDGLHGTPKYSSDGAYAFVNGNNLTNGKVVIKPDTKRVNFSEFEKYKKPLNDRTLLVSINGTLGNIAVYNGEKIILGKSACYINVKTKYDRDFIFYTLSSPTFRNYMETNATGTTIKNFSLKQMREFSFSLPDIAIQKRISSILTDIDNKIATNIEINDNLQQQAKALYAEMFLGSSNDDVISGTLSDIAVITMGQSPSGSSYNEDGVGEVFYQGRAEFGFRFPKRRLFTTEPKRMAETGDVLLSVRAPVGDLNVAYEECCIGRGLGAIHSKTGHSSFVLYTMFALRSQLDVFNGEGTVFGSINRDALNAIPIDIPPVTEINQFEAVAHPIDELIRANYEENCRLEAIRDTLIPKLMSSEIDVSAVQL